jgi:hypothetical protein
VSRLRIVVGRDDGEDPGRQQLLALHGVRRNLEPGPPAGAEQPATASVAMSRAK